MANICDYVRWRGDLSFHQSAFNVVDNLILSQIAYVTFEGIAPASGDMKVVTMEEAAKEYFARTTIQEIESDKSFIAKSPYLLREAGKSKRFKNIRLVDFVKIVDTDREIQFSAVTFLLPDGYIFVAFQGTDDTLVGWKENFNMSFLTPVPAQTEAVKYLKSAAEENPGRKIRIGGHSKGGNLAVYAALNVDSSIQKRISKIYDNDGPGFLSSEELENSHDDLKRKIIKIVPQFSVVGMLMQTEADYRVVESSETGIMQHDALSWRVEGPDFVYTDHLSAKSRIWNKAINKWCYEIEPEKRKQFIDEVFAVVQASGALTLTDINTAVFKSAGASLKMLNGLTPEKRGLVFGTFAQLYKEYVNVRNDHVITEFSKMYESMKNKSVKD